MAEYEISARLSLKDQMTAKLSAALKQAQKLSQVSKGIGDAKSRDLMWRIGVQGMQKLQRYRDLLKQAGMTTPKPVDLRVNDNGATSKIAKIKNDLMSVTGKTWQTVLNIKTNGAQALGKVKNNLTELASGAAMGMGAGVLGVAGLGYVAVNAVERFMDFEKQMSAVQAILGYDKNQMGALQAEAERIGYTTKFTAAEAAKAQYYQAMAGWKEEQMLSGTQGIVNLAAAGNEDLGRTSDVVTDLMTAFQLKAGSKIKFDGKPIQEASQFFADSMAALITNANTDIEQAYEALKYSAPAISAMYADRPVEEKAQAMQDAFVITGLMASGGVKASQAGTSQRALMTRLASENRNAYFAERALPVSLVDETTGEVRRLRDVVSDFREKFQNGLDVEEVTRFAEEISGEKIHADTRRKLNSFIANVQANGGKMTGADKLKLTSMLSGQEAMSGWLNVFLASEEDWNKLAASIDNARGKAQEMADIQTQNLSGDITKLGSAWEGLNIQIMKGSASGGLRDFVQGITDVISFANNLFKDGFQFTDVFKIAGAAIDKLKNKFLELDGIGSILAGGALFLGLKKIASMALSLKDTLSTWSKIRTASDLGSVLRGNQTPPIAANSIGTMHVNAGVVNVNGAVKGGLPPQGTSRNTQISTAQSRSQQYAANYYQRRENILASRNTIPPAGLPPITSTIATGAGLAGLGAATSTAGSTVANAGAASVLKGAAGGIAGAGILSGLFGALDVYATQSQNEVRLEQAKSEVIAQKNTLLELQKSGAAQEDIAYQMQVVTQALETQKQVQIANENAMRMSVGGAGGAVTGALAGAAIGSFVPIIGTALGGIIGGVLGQFGGTMAAEYTNNQLAQSRTENNIASIQSGSVADFHKTDEISLKNYQSGLPSEDKIQQVNSALTTYAESISRHQQIDRAEIKGSRIIDNDSKLESAREYLHSASYEYDRMRERAEMNTAVANRENYFESERLKQQQMFGGRFTGNIAPYQPKDEREAQLLKRYDAQKEVELREQNIAHQKELNESIKNANLTWRDMAKPVVDAKTTFQAAEEAKAQSDSFAARRQAFSDAFTNNDGEGILSSIGKFFDNLLFSKAAAATPESVSQPAQVEQGIGDFQLPNIGELISNFELPNINELISNAFSNIELPELGIAEKLTAEFEGASAIFDNFVMTAQNTFANLGTAIQGGVEGARAAITTAFDSAAAQVQGVWGAIPGFFSGVFSGLGGAASAAGSAIYSGLTSVIGGIIGAWQSAAATISGIISRIASAASSAASSAGSFIGIGHNATGTMNWQGGWTEINERGGEIVNLPQGTKIYPHETTVNMLRQEIRSRINSGAEDFHGLKFADFGLHPQNVSTDNFSTNNFSSQDTFATKDMIIPNLRGTLEKSKGQRQNIRSSSVFERIVTGVGDLIPGVGNIFNSVSSTFNKLFGGISEVDNSSFTDVSAFNNLSQNENFMGTLADDKFQLPFNPFNDNESPLSIEGGGEIELPKFNFDFPKGSSTSNSTSNSSSNSTNNFNFGGVTVNNGTDFEDFVYQLQQLLTGASANSILF